MLKFSIILLFSVVCLADNLDKFQQLDGREVQKFGQNSLFDHLFEKSYGSQLQNGEKTLDEKLQDHGKQDKKFKFDNDKEENIDENEVLDANDEFYDSDGIEEDEALENQVQFLDTTREALLKFSTDLRKEKNVTNAFSKVISGLERRIADFQASLGRRKINPGSVKKIEQFIKEAAKDRKQNSQVLQALTAQGLFMAQEPSEGARAKRGNLPLAGAANFLKTIEKEIGKTTFEKLLSFKGLVTLLFVMDTTGSMSEEIDAAKAIATQIVNQPRGNYEVNYLLSPFNDPKTGPVTLKSSGQGKEFVSALQALTATDGDDCPELCLTGILAAFEEGPQLGSPMYVFTDAPPKDSLKKDDVINNADYYGVPINFFTSTSGCGRTGEYDVYDEIAKKTGGLVLPFKNTNELKKLGEMVSSGLGGSATIGKGGKTGEAKYKIPVDDSIEKITIIVTTKNSGAGVTLVDPKGKTVTEDCVNLEKGAVYDISNPTPGEYTLTVPATAGAHEYEINAVSGTNIDFSHYYTLIARRGTNRNPIPIQHPLEGIETSVFIAVAGADSVNTASLTVKVVDVAGKVHHHKPMKPVGTSGIRFVVGFMPPPGSFKLEIHGKTKKGTPFVRTSAREDPVVPVTLRLAYSANANILFRGETTEVRIQIRRGNTGDDVDTYTVGVKDDYGYGKAKRPTERVRRGRMKITKVKFSVPADAPTGKTLKAEVTLIKNGRTEATLILSLLVV